MANIIRGNKDGDNGSNDSYRIPGRGSNIPREQVVREIKDGKHPNHAVYERGGEEYARAKPDSTAANNVDPDQS